MLAGFSLLGWAFELLWLNLLAALLGILSLFSFTLAQKIVNGWLYIGAKLGWVNSRIILTVIFYGLLTPLAFFYRLTKKNPLQLKKEPEADSYFITRNKTFTPRDFEKPF